MQVGQRFGVREPGGFRYEALDELQHPVGAVDEALENLMRVDAAAVSYVYGLKKWLEMRESGQITAVGSFH